MKILLLLSSFFFFHSDNELKKIDKKLLIKDVECIYFNFNDENIGTFLESFNFQKVNQSISMLLKFKNQETTDNTSIEIKFKKNIIEEINIVTHNKEFIRIFLHSCEMEMYKDIGFESEENGYYGIWKQRKYTNNDQLYLGGIIKTDSSSARFIFKTLKRN